MPPTLLTEKACRKLWGFSPGSAAGFSPGFTLPFGAYLFILLL
jgi:hypothetical protein